LPIGIFISRPELAEARTNLRTLAASGVAAFPERLFAIASHRHGRVTGILREGVEAMEVHFTPEVQAKLDQMARDTGRRSDELVENVVTDFLEDFAFTRETLDRRYDDLESGRVKAIPGDEVFARLRAKSAARRAGR
jgi:predicted transcriptional regulator